MTKMCSDLIKIFNLFKKLSMTPLENNNGFIDQWV